MSEENTEKNQIETLTKERDELQKIAQHLLQACQTALVASPQIAQIALKDAVATATGQAPDIAVVSRKELHELQAAKSELEMKKMAETSVPV